MMSNRHNVFSLFLAASLIASSCPGSVSGKPVVCAGSSLDRVLQDDDSFQGSASVELYCARGESESFQVFVSNPGDQPISGVSLNFAFSDWRYTGSGQPGNSLPRIEMYREHAIPIREGSPGNTVRSGRYPDALIPLENPWPLATGGKILYPAEVTVQPHSSQGYWIDLECPPALTAGVYSNSIRVTGGQTELGTIGFRVTVWDFQMPTRHVLKTWYNPMNDLGRFHSVASPQRRKLVEDRYFQLIARNGFTPILQTIVTQFDRDGTAIFTPKAVAEMKDFAQTYGVEFFRVPAFYSEDESKAAVYLKSYQDFLERNPWAGQGIVYMDEPNTKEAYDRIRRYGGWLHQYSPKIRFLVTEQIRPDKPEWGSLEGAVDIWVPSWELANVGDIRRRQAAGDEVWSYSALYHPSVPNWLLESPLLDYRIPSWFSWSLDLKGILYWRLTAWDRKESRVDPWTDPQTYVKGGRGWNGEGCLVYPGTPAGIDGPVASMRLKVFRDSMEDFDYFSLLSQSAGRPAVDAIVKPVASDFQTFSRAPGEYQKARIAIGEAIARAANPVENK